MTATMDEDRQREQKAHVTGFVRDWLHALRGGEYAQSESYLKTSEGYCCLGVACDVAGLAGEDTDDDGVVTSDGVVTYSFFGSKSETHLPGPLREFIDLDVSFQSELVELNDNNHSFEEIATKIENYYRQKGYVL